MSTQSFDTGPLERFCMNKKVKSYQAQFFEEEGQVFWSIVVMYEPLLEEKKKSKKDWLAGLSKEEKVLFEKLRIWRKEAADTAGFPPYLIAKNEQLVGMIQQKVMSLQGFENIHGFGKQKRSKYGKEIIEIIQNFYQTNE